MTRAPVSAPRRRRRVRAATNRPHSSTARRPKVLYITFTPTPYRMPVHDRLRQSVDFEFKVVFRHGTMPDRSWEIRGVDFADIVIDEEWRQPTFRVRVKEMLALLRVVRTYDPDVIIGAGYDPFYLVGWLFALLNRRNYIVHTDGTIDSESDLSWVHVAVRRIVALKADAYIGCGDGSTALYQTLGVARDRIFTSRLAIDNDAFASQRRERSEQLYDFLFCGRLVYDKNPEFAIDVARGVSRRLGRPVSLAIVGEGPLLEDVQREAAASADQVRVTFAGFQQPDQMPGWFGGSSVFLFPTRKDPWGLVANESAAAGTPVVVSPFAGSARELVETGHYGRVVPLDLDRWVDACVELLGTRVGNDTHSDLVMTDFTLTQAASGMDAAIRHVLSAYSKSTWRRAGLMRRVIARMAGAAER